MSGIGFLGGGAILRDGLHVRGLNTAPATLWCTAAIGTLAACGYLVLSIAGTAGVLVTNLVLRPLAYRINRVSTESEEDEILYRFRYTCRAQERRTFVPFCSKTWDERRWRSLRCTATTMKRVTVSMFKPT